MFHKAIHYKPRQVLAHSDSIGDDYTPAPTSSTKTEKECIELGHNEVEKDKDYYFMDTSLLGKLDNINFKDDHKFSIVLQLVSI